jgi:hypothetical protein
MNRNRNFILKVGLLTSRGTRSKEAEHVNIAALDEIEAKLYKRNSTYPI